MRQPLAWLLLLLALCRGQTFGGGGGRVVADGDDSIYPGQSKPPEGAAKLGLNVPLNEQYLEQIRALHRAADASVVDRLVRSQQLFRRATERPDNASVPVPYALLDCTPMFIHKKSWFDMLRVVTLKTYTCHAVCLNYPACTSTTPLASVEPIAAAGAPAEARRLGAVVQCGMRVFRVNDRQQTQPDQVLALFATNASASSPEPVCHNTVSRARSFDGGQLRYVAAGSSGSTTSVSLAAYPGTELRDGLLINVNDLWSSLQVLPLRLLLSEPGGDYWTKILAPMRGDLDTSLSSDQLAGALRNSTPEQQQLQALWTVAPQLDGSLSATFSHSMDATCPRWLSFPFYGPTGAGGATPVSALYANVTGGGVCAAVAGSMDKVGAYLGGIPVAERPGGPCLTPNYPEYTTTTVCDAAQRLAAGAGAPLALQAPLSAVADKAVVRGCTAAPVFLLDTFGGFSDLKCGPAYATPSIEVVTSTGEFHETYLDAGLLQAALDAANEVEDLSQKWPADYKWVDLRVQANASHFEDLIAAVYRKDMRELDQLKLGPSANRDRTAILTALGLLMVATLQLPISYDRKVRGTMARLADRIGPGGELSRACRATFVFAGCIVTLAAPIAAAMVSLVLATKTMEDEVYMPGYPQVSQVNAPSGHKADEQARDGRLGLETTTVVTVTATPHVAALAGICAACGLLVVLGASLSARSQYLEDSGLLPSKSQSPLPMRQPPQQPRPPPQQQPQQPPQQPQPRGRQPAPRMPVARRPSGSQTRVMGGGLGRRPRQGP